MNGKSKCLAWIFAISIAFSCNSYGDSAAILIKDIWPGSEGSEPKNLFNWNGTLLFTAVSPEFGHELWRSDGTKEGTVLVKDIYPGSPWSFSSFRSPLFEAGGTVFFGARDIFNGRELWKTNGTAAGTVLVKDINPGMGTFEPNGSSPRNFSSLNGKLLFTAFDDAHGTELWTSDGTLQGTVLVKDFDPGPGYGVGVGFTHFLDGFMYGAANDGVNGYQLWKTDGTPGGTMVVKDIHPQAFLGVYNDHVIFVGCDGVHGCELWKTDGTTSGTVLIKDITPGPFGHIFSRITNFKGNMYFRANDGATGFELWKSDGTANGTVLIKDINPGIAGAQVSGMTVLNDVLLFRAWDRSFGQELWITDGSEEGTERLDIISGGPGLLTQGPNYQDFQKFTTNQNLAYFLGTGDGFFGNQELWKSDGTFEGTQKVTDILAGPDSSRPTNLTNVDGTLYFVAQDGIAGRELHKLIDMDTQCYVLDTGANSVFPYCL